MPPANRQPRRAGRPLTPITRDELLTCARRAFAEQGYAATSMNRIAEAAGLRKASLFHHFESKRALYLEVLSGVVAELAGMVACARLNEGDYLERLDRLGGLVVDHLAAHPEAARLLTMELTGNGPFLHSPGLEQARDSLRITVDFLDAGMRAGSFRRQDPSQLAWSIISLHLVWYAGADLASSLIGQDVLADDAVAARKAAVVAQVRALCT